MINTTRRGLLGACGSLALGSSIAKAAPGPNAFALIERAHGGRLGVFAFDTASAHALAWRADETFPMQSTFKGPLAALVLQRVQDGQDHLAKELPYGPSDMLPVSPVTQEHLPERQLTIGQLTAAILETSDNTAANLLLAHIGGPAALTRYLRSIGDDVTQIRRPEMLEPSTTEDNTTTPRALAKLMQTLLMGPSLQSSSKGQLRAWMGNNDHGRTRLRASFPPGWAGVDRTGTGDGICNDGAMTWPPGRSPLAMAAFYVAPGTDLSAQEAVLRDVSRTIIHNLSGVSPS